ncbi:protein DEFECTIVE IN MERISTEM SILENCING 3-like isoform X1 [Coffea arabica]|uniref:Protein DEFECTIVE IN MERISTEM SILENCING 3 isoform X3 n=1 Tax=Coffea arabica TaxID=13443 RepID=A0ABM4VM02_COFAR
MEPILSHFHLPTILRLSRTFPLTKMPKLEDDIHCLGLKIKQHEDNIKYLRQQVHRLDDSILDMQVALGKYHSSSTHRMENKDLSHVGSEEEMVEHILAHENSAAGTLFQLKACHESHASHLAWMKDVVGVVATLGNVEDDNLSRLLSEYLGTEKMLAVVCKTHNCVKALEAYDKEGFISKTSGLHELGASIERPLDGRFLAICLENLRPFVGNFVVNDPQRRLDIVKPRLPNGETPPGFLGFAVNMINIDKSNLYFVTSSGRGLRETLFYSLFSRLQVYRTREEMLRALPFMTDAALSLDGGIMRGAGMFCLGKGKDVVLRFPKNSGRSSLPKEYFETETAMKEEKWKKERLSEDIRREQIVLDQVKFNYEIKKQEFVKYLAESSSHSTQHQLQSERERLTPRS